jgi:small subunit ribosomal protein S15
MSKKTPVRKSAKTDTIVKQQIHKDDTGSVEVQVSVLTQEINDVAVHLQTNPKDHSSRKGLVKKVGKRQALLRYVKNTDFKRFQKIAAKSKLKSV